MSELLFDTPWWLPAMLCAAGVVLFVTGNKRVEAKLRNAGLGVILAAILLVVVSYVVDTPRETAERRTGELIDAFERADWPAMASILDRDAVVTVLDTPVFSGRDAIVARAKTAHAQYGFKSVRVLSSGAEQVDTVITVTVTLLTEQNTLASTLNSQWQFEWRKSADGWSLVEVRALQIGQSTGDQIRGMMPRK